MTDRRQADLFLENPRLPTSSEARKQADEFAAKVAHVEEVMLEYFSDLIAGDPVYSRAFVVAAVKLAADMFIKHLHQGEAKLDPRWFLGVCNAVLTVVAHERGVKVKFPMDPLLLPDEGKEMLVASNLATPEEVGLCPRNRS